MRVIDHGLTVLHSVMVDDFEQKIRSNAVTPELMRLVEISSPTYLSTTNLPTGIPTNILT